MSSRIDVELTSERPDGTWTWRAAGARQPKGVLDGGLLPDKAKVGDVVRAEADFDVDGITVTAVLPPRAQRREPERLEILGPPPEERSSTGGAAEGGKAKARRPERSRRPRTGDGERGAPGRDGERRQRPEQRSPRRDVASRAPAPAPPARPKAKKLRPGRGHRDAVLAELPPEQHPIAVQLLRGGMPAVRTALNEQNTKAKKEGVPEAPVVAVLAIAERLHPRLRLAEWLDRAEAALADADDLALRDLRSVVVSADEVARDPSTREVATQLREVLERRTAAERQAWLDDVAGSLDAGRVVRALRLSSRPPQPGDHLPAEVTTRLTEAAGAAMTADAGPDRWATVLDAVAYSSVRRSVTPAGVPPEPGDELLALVRKHAGRVPGIAQLFGIEPPEPTAPKRRGGRSERQAATHAARRSEPPSGVAPAPSRPRRIPPPPPTAGEPVAQPAPPRTSPADPPAGAAVPPAGQPATEPGPPADETPAPPVDETPAPPVDETPAPPADETPPPDQPPAPPSPPTGTLPSEPLPPTAVTGAPGPASAPEAAAPEAPVTGAPAAQPAPSEAPPVADPVAESDRSERDEPGPAAPS